MPTHCTLDDELCTLVPLSQGEYAIINIEDLPLIKSYSPWYMLKPAVNKYAVTNTYHGSINGKEVKTHYRMHRLILGLKAGEICDHINGNGLDNRRSNLRKVTNAQNLWNRNQPAVELMYGKWRARIQVNGKVTRLGKYATKQEAITAYWKAAEIMRGPEFCTRKG